MSNRYSGFPCSMYVGGVLRNFRQLESHSFSPNSNKSTYTPGGSLDRLNATLHSAKPIHRWSTRDLETVFVTAGISPSVGAASSSGSADASAAWNYQQRQCSSGFDGSAVHIGRETSSGFIRPVSLSSGEDDTDGAIVSLEYMTTARDDTTDPEIKLAGRDLSGLSQPAFVSQFFHGPSYYNGIVVPGIDRFSANFGINVDAKLFGGVFPQCYVIQSRAPSITLSGTNAAISAALSQFINTSLGTGWVHYLRRGASGGSRVSDATAVHMAVSMTSSEWCVNEESWQQTNDVQSSVEVMAIDATIAINATTTIP